MVAFWDYLVRHIRRLVVSTDADGRQRGQPNIQTLLLQVSQHYPGQPWYKDKYRITFDFYFSQGIAEDRI